ncbi:hypothetical protein C0Q70_09928 [Pomacea canaliculata]|uniref:Uncharacterized protein n=1 Tax=Pomacea canaliculata TaxID=400727 RepID=A0A2T7PB53_POMCA|nr:hypothetical protein C0Q70_09928 [Pomacea canaliculata]
MPNKTNSRIGNAPTLTPPTPTPTTPTTPNTNTKNGIEIWQLGVLALTLAGVEGWVNQYDDPFSWSCPAGQFISSITSIHNDHYEDRLLQFHLFITSCSGSVTNCQWSDYVNEFDEPLNYQCPGQGFIVGIGSYHNSRTKTDASAFSAAKFEGPLCIRVEPHGGKTNGMDL